MADPAAVAAKPDAVRKFLAATEEGYKLAMADPAAAADLMTQLANAENPAMAEKLDADFMRASAAWYAGKKVFLDGEGKWGRMDYYRWDAWLDWLHSNGLLTAAVHSRTPDGIATVSLDDLRQGKAGELLPRAAVSASALFSMDYFA